MVFGTVNRERIQLNEETLWMGGPRETDNPEARAALPEVRRLLFAGQPREAYALAERKLMGKPWRLESYQSLADLRLNFDHEGEITDYRRSLDLDAGVARVTYRVDGVRYTREVFASHPDRVIVVRLTVDRPGALTFGTWIDRQQDARTEIAGNDRLNLIGQLGGRQGPVVSGVGAGYRRGRHAGDVPGAHSRVRRERRHHRRRRRHELQGQRSAQPGGSRPLTRAAQDRIRNCSRAHRADHQRLYRRVALRLGSAAAAPRLLVCPTDERLDAREARRLRSRRSTPCISSSAATC